jgi:hypothetical protein
MFDGPTEPRDRETTMAPTPQSSLVTRFLEELEVHRTTATELSLILLAPPAVARALAALTVLFSAGHGPAF